MSGSPNSATRVIDACSAAADELAASRRLIGLLERENDLLTERLDTEKRISKLLTELSEARRAENEGLRIASAAQKETIAAKNAVIADQEKLNAALKKRASSPWKRLGDVLIGVAAGIVLR